MLSCSGRHRVTHGANAAFETPPDIEDTMANKERTGYPTGSMAIRECHVNFVDARGVRHSVTVYASSVLEAAAAGLKLIRETEMIEDESVLDLTVDLMTSTSHKVPLSKLKAWLENSGRDPREAARKMKLR
jgi:hypothetical protein